MTYMEEQAFTKKTYTFQGHEYSKWVVEPMGDYTRVRFFEKMGGRWVVVGWFFLMRIILMSWQRRNLRFDSSNRSAWYNLLCTGVVDCNSIAWSGCS